MKQLHFFESNPSLKNFKDQFDLLLKEKQAISLIRISFLILGICWLLLGVFYRYLPPEIPLFFSRPWGEAQLVEKKYFIGVPSILTLLFLINHRLASVSITKDKLLSYIFLTTHILISILAITTMVRIIILLA